MTVNVGYSIADISAIKSLPTALLVNGYARLCRSTNAWFSYDPTSTVTADDISVLLPSSGTGRWLKLKADTVSGLVNPMTTIGDIIVGASGGTPSRLAPNNTTAQKYLSQYASSAALWTPASISTQLWLDAADAATITQSSGLMTQWTNKGTATANNATATTPQRPTYGTYQLNGLNLVSVRGSEIGMATGYNLTTPYSIVLVSRNYSGGRVVQSSDTNSLMCPYRLTFAFYAAGGTVRDSAITTAGQWSTVTMQILGSSPSQLWYNSTDYASGTNGNWGGFNIGNVGLANETSDADIAEILVFNYSLTEIDRQKIEGYIAHKWGLTDNLPSDHPYKVAAPTISSAGTLTTAWSELANSGVTAGSYTNANVTVDSKGRVTTATSGTSTGLTNPMTTKGDIIVSSDNSGTPSRLAPNNTTAQKYLSQYASPAALWTPASTTTALWLDAADSATITTVSGAVSQWNDKSGNSRNATQSTSGNRPLITTSELNGLNVITFDGTNDYFEADLGSISQPYMIFFCGRANGNTAGGAVSAPFIFDSKVGEPTRTTITFNPNGTSADNGKLAAAVIPNIITTSGVISYNAPTILAIVFDGTSSYIYSEGSLSLSGILATGSLTKIILGQRQTLDSAVTTLNGYFADFAIIAGNNSATRQKAEGYLAHKWGLTDNLPSDHPYKSTPPTTGGVGTLTTAWNELANSGVTAGSYTNANVTVDSKGRVVSAASGNVAGGSSIIVSGLYEFFNLI